MAFNRYHTCCCHVLHGLSCSIIRKCCFVCSSHFWDGWNIHYNILIKKKKKSHVGARLAIGIFGRFFFFLSRETLRQYYQNMNLRVSYQSSGSGRKTKLSLEFNVMQRMEENWNSCSFLWSHSIPFSLNLGGKKRKKKKKSNAATFPKRVMVAICLLQTLMGYIVITLKICSLVIKNKERSILFWYSLLESIFFIQY